MRTTLDISDEVMGIVRELAAVRGMTIGAVLSELALRGLARPAEPAPVRNGVPLLSRRPEGARRPTMQLVNDLRDDG
jgi:hypothetical protein